MIEFLKMWANQIIVAAIIATIFEMLLPSGNNKKYIKMIIGIYLLFTIIHPIISKVRGGKLEISDFNYKKYFDEDILETSIKDFEYNNSKLIKQEYIDNIKSDVKTKMRQKGYELISLSIDIFEDESLDNYGNIKNISLGLEKIYKEETEEKSTNTIEIENVDINIVNSINDSSNTINNTEQSNISDKEKTNIIEYIADEYSMDKKNIIIN